MRLLIIPDRHCHTEHADHWRRTQTCDRVVFLGDYCKDFDDAVSDACKTAIWLRRRMQAAQADAFLPGSHDAPYQLPELGVLYWPGFTRPKAEAIHKVPDAGHRAASARASSCMWAKPAPRPSWRMAA